MNLFHSAVPLCLHCYPHIGTCRRNFRACFDALREDPPLHFLWARDLDNMRVIHAAESIVPQIDSRHTSQQLCLISSSLRTQTRAGVAQSKLMASDIRSFHRTLWAAMSRP